MSRSLRIEFPGAVYHITSRGNARQKIYRDNDDREEFLAVLTEAINRFGWICHAYCLMDNHFHLLIETPKPNLSLGMRQLNGVYTQRFNRRHHRVGHLLQGRFKAILVEKETHLLELCRYVVLNPVRAKRVGKADGWRWSSYRATAGESEAPTFLTINWVLGQFGNRLHSAQKRYRQFVEEGREGARPWDNLSGQIYLGGAAFVAQHQPDRVIQEIPRKHTQAHRPALKEIFNAQRSVDRAIRQAYIRYGYQMQEIAKQLGVHYSTVSRRIRRAEKGDA
jgi:REP-associated tyrosine transposase